jgi:hypothetical protein
MIDAAMLAGPESIARFIAGGEGPLAAFARDGVTILENFPPHLFTGTDAATRWLAAMRAHIAPLGGLEYRFAPAQDFSQSGDSAFFTLPTHWSGTLRGRRFEEDGGWSFLLIREDGAWRVKAYGWSVTRFAFLSWSGSRSS